MFKKSLKNAILTTARDTTCMYGSQGLAKFVDCTVNLNCTVKRLNKNRDC